MSDPAYFWQALRGEDVPAGAWSGILARAKKEEVLNYLAHENRSTPKAEFYRREGAARYLAALASLKRALPLIESTGRPFALLKGMALAHTVYRHPEERTFSDIDILVDPADFRAVSAALCDRGYRQTPQHRELFIDQENRRTRIDLHTDFVNAQRISGRRAAGETPEWQHRIERVSIGEISIPILPPDLTARLLTLHLVHHHGLWGAKWIIDLLSLEKLHPATCGTIESASSSGSAVIAAMRLLDPETRRDQPILDGIDRIALRAAFEGRHIPAMRFLLSAKEIEKAADKLGFLKQSLFPNRATLESVYHDSRMRGAWKHARDVSNSALGILSLMLRA